MRSARFYRSRIRSDVRLDYDQLDQVFAGRAKAPANVAEPLALARQVASALATAPSRARRSRSPAPSPSSSSTPRATCVAATAVPQTESHSLIEQLMVLTNEQVAELLERKKVPTLYRVHEQPDPERISRLIDQLAALDIPTPPLPKHISPSQAGEIAVEASRMVAKEAERRGNGREAYTSLVLRSLKQAHYTDRNLGHAGPRQPRLRPLHLADPPLPRPDRPPRAAVGRRGGGGGARAPRRFAEAGRALLRARARGRQARAPRRRRLRRLPAQARAVRARLGRDASRARSPA